MASNPIPNSSTTIENNRHHIIWLDRNINGSNNRRKVEKLSELDRKIKPFQCQIQCIDYIEQQNVPDKYSSIILIISGALSKEVIPKIHDCMCILAIFIYCTNIDDYKHLKYEKLEAICNDTYELINRIEIYIAKDKDRELQFSLLNNQESTHAESTPSESQYPLRNLKEDQARFLWFYQGHNFMVKLEDQDNTKAKQEMISYCRKEYQDNRIRSFIDEFDRECLEENAKKAVWWYTQNSFVFKCINTVFRKEDIAEVYKYRYLIKLLCNQLKEQHEKFIHDYKQREQKTKLRLYRGQQIEEKYILHLQNHIDDLISLNGFISTTLNRDIARKFSFQHRRDGFVHVLFEIDVDIGHEHKIIFADITDLSKYREEEEILFSIGAIFRIKSIKRNGEHGLYVIRLQLTEHDELCVIDYIKQTYSNEIHSSDQPILFIKLLFDMGEYQFAIKYCLDILHGSSDIDDHLRAIYLNNLGVCYNESGNRTKALECYKKACKIYQQTNDHHGLGTCYHNIASIYHAAGDDPKALRQTLEALDYRQEKTLERASTLDLLGCIHLAMNNTEAAYDNLEDALKIRRRCLRQINPNHPDIGVSYQNLAGLSKKLSKFDDAFDYYSQAAEIYRHNYPESHPRVKDINRCLNEISR